MGYILEDRMPDGIRPTGWYGGRNKKYADMFDLTPLKEFAHVFENKTEAEKLAEQLNKSDWNFKVIPVN